MMRGSRRLCRRELLQLISCHYMRLTLKKIVAAYNSSCSIQAAEGTFRGLDPHRYLAGQVSRWSVRVNLTMKLNADLDQCSSAYTR